MLYWMFDQIKSKPTVSQCVTAVHYKQWLLYLPLPLPTPPLPLPRPQFVCFPLYLSPHTVYLCEQAVVNKDLGSVNETAWESRLFHIVHHSLQATELTLLNLHNHEDNCDTHSTVLIRTQTFMKEICPMLASQLGVWGEAGGVKMTCYVNWKEDKNYIRNILVFLLKSKSKCNLINWTDRFDATYSKLVGPGISWWLGRITVCFNYTY